MAFNNTKLTDDVNKLKAQAEKTTEEYKKSIENQRLQFQKELEENKKRYKEKVKQIQKQNEGIQQTIHKLTKIQQQCKKFKKLYKEIKSFVQSQLDNFYVKELKTFQKTGIDKLSLALKEVTDRYHKEVKLRRKYFNQIQDLKGNIRVYVRCRPFVPADGTTRTCIQHIDEQEIKIMDEEHKKLHNFEFEKVFNEKSTQFQIFEDVKPLATSILDGYNVCIFAYGQTGKTLKKIH